MYGKAIFPCRTFKPHAILGHTGISAVASLSDRTLIPVRSVLWSNLSRPQINLGKVGNWAMGRIFTIGVFTIIGIGGGFLGGRWYANTTLSDLETVKQEAVVKSVLAEGKIQPAGGFRYVTTMPGRKIEKLNVLVGSDVKAGQTELCVMADEPILKMQWELAAAKKKDLGNEVDQQILAAELNKSSVEAALKQAKLNQMRLSSESPESSYVDKKIESSEKKLKRLKELATAKATSAFVSTQDIFDQEMELEKSKAEKNNLVKGTAPRLEIGVDKFRIRRVLFVVRYFVTVRQQKNIA